MARNRQRAKQRQAERKARRASTGQAAAARREEPALEDRTDADPSPGIDPNLAVGAPPSDEGQSSAFLASEQAEAQAEDELLEEGALDLEEAANGDGAEPAYAPRGRRGREEVARGRERSRVVQFLIAVWAELQRVQWPNRQALTTLTGVTLGFVLVVGGYLGLLDAIFTRIVNAIL
jgi:preprotein translocase SecE subunit